jgi:hypothetical protein
MHGPTNVKLTAIFNCENTLGSLDGFLRYFYGMCLRGQSKITNVLVFMVISFWMQIWPCIHLFCPPPIAATKQCYLFTTADHAKLQTAHNPYGISKHVHHLPASKEDTTMLSVSTPGPTWPLNETTHCYRIWYEECIPNGGNTKSHLCNYLQKQYQHGGIELYDPTVICNIGYLKLWVFVGMIIL